MLGSLLGERCIYMPGELTRVCVEVTSQHLS